MSRECQRCGQEIVLERNKFYCSRKCSSSMNILKNGRKKIPRHNCLNCGTECRIPASKYCCKKCTFEHNKSDAAKTTSVCKICNSDFLRFPRQTLMKCGFCRQKERNESKKRNIKSRLARMSPEELLSYREKERKKYHAAKDKPGFVSRRVFPKKYFDDLIRGAKRREIEFAITMSDIIIQMIRQNGICSLSGRKINLADKTASLDRINSDLGYVLGNIQWVHKMINTMKMHFSEPDFVQACKDVAVHRA